MLAEDLCCDRGGLRPGSRDPAQARATPRSQGAAVVELPAGVSAVTAEGATQGKWRFARRREAHVKLPLRMLELLSPDCIHAILLRLGPPDALSLRASCAHALEACEDLGVRRLWYALHGPAYVALKEERRRQSEVRRLAHHFSSLDEEILETET